MLWPTLRLAPAPLVRRIERDGERIDDDGLFEGVVETPVLLVETAAEFLDLPSMLSGRLLGTDAHLLKVPVLAPEKRRSRRQQQRYRDPSTMSSTTTTTTTLSSSPRQRLV